MARIRTIKPEFWKSEAIAALDMFTRLTFIGLWTYVDDNGVGVDNYKLVAAELYGLEEDPRETRARVSRALASLHAAGRILRYTVAGKRYLSIVNWNEHQRIDRPGKPRYVGPEDPDAHLLDEETASSWDMSGQPPTNPTGMDSRDPRESVARPSRDPIDWNREQGNREQGNREVPPTAGRSLTLAPAPATADALIADWLDHCKRRPPRDVVGLVAKKVKAMLAEGIDPDDIRRGLAAWHQRGLHGSVLPSVVNEVMNATPRAAPQRKPSTTDQRVADGLALAARLDAEAAATARPVQELTA